MDFVSGLNIIVGTNLSEKPTMITIEFSPEAIDALEYEPIITLSGIFYGKIRSVSFKENSFLWWHHPKTSLNMPD
jgi:hypothetical protein